MEREDATDRVADLYNRQQHKKDFDKELAGCEKDPSGQGCSTTLQMVQGTTPVAIGSTQTGYAVTANVNSDGQAMSYVVTDPSGNQLIMQPLEYSSFTGESAQQQQAKMNAPQWALDADSSKQYFANGQWSAALANMQHVGSDSLPTGADAPSAATLQRAPDYGTFSLPVPLVPGVGVTFTLDRYGTVYAGLSGGAGFPEVSGRSWGVGWTGDPSTPDASSLRGWVSGASYNAGFGFGVTESSPLSPGANESSRMGPTVQSPGASVGYSWPLFGTGIHW